MKKYIDPATAVVGAVLLLFQIEPYPALGLCFIAFALRGFISKL